MSSRSSGHSTSSCSRAPEKAVGNRLTIGDIRHVTSWLAGGHAAFLQAAADNEMAPQESRFYSAIPAPWR